MDGSAFNISLLFLRLLNEDWEYLSKVKGYNVSEEVEKKKACCGASEEIVGEVDELV